MIYSVVLFILLFGRVVHSIDATAWCPIIVAHASNPASACPTSYGWGPDASNIACCVTISTTAGDLPATLTSSGGEYGCCVQGYTCTGAMASMMDWSISGAILETFNLAHVPTLGPTAEATVTKTEINSGTFSSSGAIPIITPQISSGTFSGSGAIPITTLASGVVSYVAYNSICSNNNSNGNGNIQDCGNGDINLGKSSGTSKTLTGAGIAGIVIAVVAAVAGIVGVWYAFRTHKLHKEQINAPHVEIRQEKRLDSELQSDADVNTVDGTTEH